MNYGTRLLNFESVSYAISEEVNRDSQGQSFEIDAVNQALYDGAIAHLRAFSATVLTHYSMGRVVHGESGHFI